MERKQNINIRIADAAPLPMSIAPETEETIRIAERNVNELWKTWSKRFPDKSSRDVLAMVAFRFAHLYFSNIAASGELDRKLSHLENQLDELLLRLDE